VRIIRVVEQRKFQEREKSMKNRQTELAAIIKRHELKQADIAVLAHISEPTLSRIANGLRYPSEYEKRLIVVAINTRLEEINALLDRTDEYTTDIFEEAP